MLSLLLIGTLFSHRIAIQSDANSVPEMIDPRGFV